MNQPHLRKNWNEKKLSVLVILSLLLTLGTSSFAIKNHGAILKNDLTQFETLHNSNPNTRFIFVDSPEDIPINKSLAKNRTNEKVIYVIKKGQTRRTCPECGITALQEYEYWEENSNASVSCTGHVAWPTGFDIASKYHVYDTEECFGCGFVNRTYLRIEYKVRCEEYNETFNIRKGKSIKDGYREHECIDGYLNWPSNWDWEL